jgi:hypothetical protein
VTDARRAASGAGTVKARRSAGSGLRKAVAVAAGVPTGGTNAGPAAIGARSRVPTATGATGAGSRAPRTDLAAVPTVRRPGSTAPTAVPVRSLRGCPSRP